MLVAAGPQTVVGRQPFRRVFVAAGPLARPCEGFGRLRRALSSHREERVAIGDVQLRPLARVARRLPAVCLVRHGDRLAEMGDRLLKGRAAQSLIARLAPPLDREVVEAGLREMMGDDFRLDGGALRLSHQDLGGAAVQRLAAAPEQAVVSRVLNQRVFEAIVRRITGALDDEEVRRGEPVNCELEVGVVDPAHSARQRVGKITPQDSADLRDFACFAKPVKPRRKRLLQRRRDSLQAAGRAALKQKARDLLDEQRHPAGAARSRHRPPPC